MQAPWRHYDVRHRIGPVAFLLCLALGGAYASLLSFQQVDRYIFPGNELNIASIPVALPGTSIGTNVPIPGTQSEPPPWTREDQINILVMGLDRRPGFGEDEPARSDTLFVASIDKASGTVQMLAIPRDLWANVPIGDVPGEQWAPAKINAAFSFGILYAYPGGGAAAAIAAVEHNYHIDIDNYLVIDWEGFVRLIDAIGGIDIDVPEPISDFSTDVLDSFENRTVQAGPQHMSGVQALGYSRVRVDGDLKRIERQQLVIRSVANRSLSLGLIAKLPELWNSYHDAIRTDVTNPVGFAALARKLDLANIVSYTLGDVVSPGIAEDGQLILLPDFDGVYRIIDDFLADPRARAESPTIVVQYAAGLDAEAETVRAHLAGYGIPPGWVQVIEGAPDASGISDLTGVTYTTNKLRDLFDLPVVDYDGEAPPGADILVRIAAPVTIKTP